MFLPIIRRRKPLFLATLLLCLVAVDVVVSRSREAVVVPPPVDSLLFESGSEEVDGFTSASIKTHVSLVRSDYSGLSAPAADTAVLTDAQICAMVLKAIQLDKHYGTTIPELKYLINAKGANAWVTLMPNFNAVPGFRYLPGDATDPRIIRAVLDYIVDSTTAKRVTLVCGGSYGTYSGETDFFTTEAFTTTVSGSTQTARWCTHFPDLDSHFTIQSMVTAAKSRQPAKTVECVNTNYNEILTGGTPYNELDSASRAGKLPEYYPVPANNRFGLGAMPSSNAIADSGRYNPTDAVKNCDILVNLPVMKITGDVQVNCVFKNYIGSVSRAVYSGGAYPSNRATALNALDHGLLVNTVLNLFSMHPTDYCFVDALSSLEGEGSHPWSNRTGWLRRNFVLAGGDPVAVEAVAAASMNLNPLDIDMLRWASAKNWGCLNLGRIAVVGTPLSVVKTDMLAPAGGDGVYGFPGFATLHYLGRGCRRWLVSGPYAATDNTTEHIPEADADPRPGDAGWQPLYSSTDAVDLITTLPAAVNGSVVYAYAQIFSETDQTGRLYVGGTRDVRVYLNGQKVVDTAGIITYANANIIRDITLKRGDNRILVKVRRSGTQYKFSLAAVNSGLESPRTTYRPHNAGGRGLGSPVTMSQDLKRAFFGGRTLPGTFYHLGQSDPIAVEVASRNASLAALHPNSPNPFQSSTLIPFSVGPREKQATLSIVTPTGRLVATLYNGPGMTDVHTVHWDGKDANGRPMAAGVYLARLTTGTRTFTRQLLYLR